MVHFYTILNIQFLYSYKEQLPPQFCRACTSPWRKELWGRRTLLYKYNIDVSAFFPLKEQLNKQLLPPKNSSAAGAPRRNKRSYGAGGRGDGAGAGGGGGGRDVTVRRQGTATAVQHRLAAQRQYYFISIIEYYLFIKYYLLFINDNCKYYFMNCSTSVWRRSYKFSKILLDGSHASY